MALLQCNFTSEAINIKTGINVILPQPMTQGKFISEDKKYPTLYLLHGYTDDYTTWCRMTSIERYAQEYELAIVMPEVGKSFYNNFHGIENGYRYWTYVSEELLYLTRKYFPLSDKREDTFVAGLSMGGFGAFKLALNCPDRFSAAASLSGAVDLLGLKTDETERNPEFEMVFGDLTKLEGTPNDLISQAKKCSDSGVVLPKLYQCCGTEDFLYEGNIRFRDSVKDLKFDYTYEESPGEHTWGFWDCYIQKVLKWLPL